MVIYEITASVNNTLIETYETYMIERHIPDLLGSGCFAGASFARSMGGRYRIRYDAHDREHLDRYLAEHAPRTREDFVKHFPTGVLIEREEWDVLKIFDN